jgi:hypothetical protein
MRAFRGLRVTGLRGSRVRDLGSRVRGLGSEVRGLGSGVRSSFAEFRVDRLQVPVMPSSQDPKPKTLHPNPKL